MVLVAFALLTFFAFDMYEAFGSRMNAWPVILLMFLPLAACGVSLLGATPDVAPEEAEVH